MTRRRHQACEFEIPALALLRGCAGPPATLRQDRVGSGLGAGRGPPCRPAVSPVQLPTDTHRHPGGGGGGGEKNTWFQMLGRPGGNLGLRDSNTSPGSAPLTDAAFELVPSYPTLKAIQIITHKLILRLH